MALFNSPDVGTHLTRISQVKVFISANLTLWCMTSVPGVYDSEGDRKSRCALYRRRWWSGLTSQPEDGVEVCHYVLL